jgi:hypothetical protein
MAIIYIERQAVPFIYLKTLSISSVDEELLNEWAVVIGMRSGKGNRRI